MIRLRRDEYEADILRDFYDDRSVPYETALENAVYWADMWADDDDEYMYLVTFDEIKKDFDSWTPADRAEYLQGDDTPDYTVYDWIDQCLWCSLWVINGYHRLTDRQERI